jgi:hypothetical protein
MFKRAHAARQACNFSWPRKITAFPGTTAGPASRRLRYAYRVDQRDYVGTSAALGWTPIYGLREQAETTASHYTPGENLTVYYDPENPGTAVLEPANRQGSFAPLLFSAIFAIAGGGMLTFFVKIGFDH